jgi:hypothetical protein
MPLIRRNQNIIKRIASVLKKGLNHNRIYVKKHSDVLRYLYENEQAEIKIIAESVNKVIKKGN